MAYRKLTAPRIFTGKYFITDSVLITTETGRIIDLVEKADAGDDAEYFDGILSPGFVNAHCHTELSHMKGLIPEETGMVPFIMKVMFERQADEMQKQAAIETALSDMYVNGIAAIGDICNTSDSVAAKAATSQLYFQNFIECSGFVPATAHTRFQQAADAREKFLQYFPSAQASITPHAPYSVSPKLLQMIADQAPAILSIHNQESQAEEDFIRHKKGDMLRLYDAIGIDLQFFEPSNISSMQYFIGMLPKNIALILVHNCFTTKTDIEWLQQNDYADRVSFCLCPNANLYIGNPLPQISLLQQSGIPVCIGTDSLASNWQLSILAELQTLHQHFPYINTETLLRWATFNGAKALQIDNEYGRFVKGAKPGVIQLIMDENDSLQTARVQRIL